MKKEDVKPICLNSKVDGKQPSVQDRVYSADGVVTAVTCAFPVKYAIKQVGNIYPDTDKFKNRTAGRVYHPQGVAPTLDTMQGGNREPKIVEPTIAAMRGRYNDEGKVEQQLEINDSGSSNTLTSVQKDNLVCSGLRIRKLTPRECFRLMDVDEEAIDKIQASGVSNTQMYRMAGNSIVVNVLYHIFRKLYVDTESNKKQLKLF